MSIGGSISGDSRVLINGQKFTQKDLDNTGGNNGHYSKTCVNNICTICIDGECKIEGYDDYVNEISECYKEVKDESSNMAAAKISFKKAVNEQIDWEINNNWKIRLPENQKEQIKIYMFQQNLDAVLKLLTEKYDGYVKNLPLTMFANKYAPTLDAKKACNEIERKLKEPSIKAEIEMAKEAIRVAFRENFGEKYKVTLKERMADILHVNSEHNPEPVDLGLP